MLMQTVKLILFIERYLHERWGTPQGKYYTNPPRSACISSRGTPFFLSPKRSYSRYKTALYRSSPVWKCLSTGSNCFLTWFIDIGEKKLRFHKIAAWSRFDNPRNGST